MSKAAEKLDASHRHEAMDRAWMLANNVSEWLADHPYVMADASLKKKAGKAVMLLSQIYQEIGNREAV